VTAQYDADVYAARNRNIVYDVVVEAIEKAAAEDGVTQKQIAERIGRKPPQVSNWLSGPGNWTLDTVSHLLRGIGATMEYTVVFDQDRRRSNIFNSASSIPLSALTQTTGAIGRISTLTADSSGTVSMVVVQNVEHAR
jgi:transcriptional regulator with XRE-family HTH domain